MLNVFYYETKIGRIRITEDDRSITGIILEPKEEREHSSQYHQEETTLIREASKQLNEYLEGSRREFTVPLNPQGTVFQKRVWEALRDIPYGETRSYQQIAEAVGNGKASRAVGMANHNNPIICMIPCHRVIGANGSLVGYAGGLDVKKQLLELEHRKDV